MNEYKVVEKFVSINGEGQKQGELACFIRFAGCNLNCGYCDTKWANKADVTYEVMDAEGICEYVRKCKVKNVTLTGGEPLYREGMHELIKMLSSLPEMSVEIETNGAVALEPYMDLSETVSFTMDYKLAGSGMEDYMCLDNMKLLKHKDTVKFVISSKEDMDRARDIVNEYKLDQRTKVYLSSSFEEIKPSDIVDYMIENNMNNVKIQLQIHKYIWDPQKRGV